MFRNKQSLCKRKQVFYEGLEGCVVKNPSDVTPEDFFYLMGLLRLFPQGKTEESEWH